MNGKSGGRMILLIENPCPIGLEWGLFNGKGIV